MNKNQELKKLFGDNQKQQDKVADGLVAAKIADGLLAQQEENRKGRELLHKIREDDNRTS